MTDRRKAIERRFEELAAFICRNSVATLLVLIAAFIAMASGVPKLTIDASNEAFLHPNDPTLAQYNSFKDQFGREDAVIIAIEPDQLFTMETLGRIKSLHDELRSGVPHRDDVISLINARETKGDVDQLIVGDLLARWPSNTTDLEALKTRVMGNPLYVDQLISSDARFTTIVLTLNAFSSEDNQSEADILAGFDDVDDNAGIAPVLLSDVETREAVDSVFAIVERHNQEEFRLYVAGMPIVTEALKAAIQIDMKKFMALAVVGIGICLLMTFQHLIGVVLPMAVVVLSLVSTMGLMGHFGVSIKVPTIILPSFLLAVSVGASVHVLAIYFQQLQDGNEKVNAIIFALGHSGLAIALTSLTTAVGLGSFATAEVAPIADLGIFAGLGTLLSLVFTIVLLPALLTLVPVLKPQKTQVHTALFDRALLRIADFSTGNPKAIVLVFLIALTAFLASASQLRFTHNVLTWMPKEWSIRQATQKIDQELRGSVVVEVVVDTGRENGLYDLVVLNKLDKLAQDVGAYENEDLFVGKVFSVVDLLKEIHKALNENKPEYYKIPTNADLVPQEFLLFENSGSDDLETIIDSRFQTARFSIRVPWRDALVYTPFLADISELFEAEFGDTATVQTTGMLSILSRTLTAAISSMAKSYTIAFVAILGMMMALVGSVKYGALAMVPNLTPIVIVMGAMYWMGIPLNMFTMLVGSIAIGLAVDDTVHFMHNFRRYHAETGDVREAVRLTLHTTGRAMLVTSIVLGVGFYVFIFATLSNVIQFGFLTGTAIILALVADFLMLPALLALTMSDSKEVTQ